MAANQGVLNQGAINPLNAAPAEVSGYKSEGQSEERNVITGHHSLGLGLERDKIHQQMFGFSSPFFYKSINVQL